MKDNLDYFNFLSSIDSDKANIIKSLFLEKSIKKNSYLLSEGQICRDVYIITKGVIVKSFDYADKDVTSDIYLAGDIVFSFHSFTYQTKSAESILAVTDVELLYLNYNNYSEAMEKHPWFSEFDSRFMESYIVQLESKLKDIATLNAAQRYEKILNNYPRLLQEVPLKIIASYLNISAERLSRIRAIIK